MVVTCITLLLHTCMGLETWRLREEVELRVLVVCS
jgi:hypothetical protein